MWIGGMQYFSVKRYEKKEYFCTPKHPVITDYNNLSRKIKSRRSCWNGGIWISKHKEGVTKANGSLAKFVTKLVAN